MEAETAGPLAESLEEIWALFAEDGREALDAMEEALLALESSPNDAGQIGRLFRALHTFKGNARMMGLSVIESLAHRAEDVVALLRDRAAPLSPHISNLLLEVHDTQRAMLDDALQNRRDWEKEDVKDLTKRLETLLAEQLRRLGDSAESPPATLLPPAGEAEEEMLFSTAVTPPARDVHPTEPAADAGYVRIFLELAGEELTRLHSALEYPVLEDGERARRIATAVHALRRAAGRMGYERLVAILDELASAAPDDSLRLAALEAALRAELTSIQETARALGVETPLPSFAPSPPATVSEIGALFRQRCLEGLLAHLADLRRTLAELEEFRRQFLLGCCDLRQSEPLIAQSARLLRAIYPHCIFQELRSAAHATLTLEDLYLRVGQEELMVSPALLELTCACCTELEQAAQEKCGGEQPSAAPFERLIARAEELLCMHSANPIVRLAADLLHRLDLSPALSEVLTPENLLEVSRAMQAGETFYTLLADLNRDERLGAAFFDWAKVSGVRLITNATVFCEDHTLFDFLLAAPLPYETLRDSLARIDPHGEHFSLRECHLTPSSDLHPAPARQPTAPSSSAVDFLGEIQARVGELTASRATLHRIVRRLSQENLSDAVARMVQQAGGDLQRACHLVQSHFETWDDDLNRLAQLEVELGTALGQFQETALALRARPAAEMLEMLPRFVQEIAQHEGKLVELTVEGGETRLDAGLCAALSDPLRRLTRACLVHAIETPAQRRAAGKPVTARLSVTLQKMADRVRLIIADDGRGPGAAEEAELATLRAQIQLRRGRLDVSGVAGQGTRRVLEQPLDLVVMDGLVMRVGEVYYVAPIEAVRRIVKPQERQIVRSSAEDGALSLRLEAEDELWPILTLDGRLLPGSLFAIVDADGERAVAVAVNELIGQQQVMLQPLQPQLAGARYAQACALLGEGEVGMVLDLSQIAAAAVLPTRSR